jgi:hypothetical protein
MVSGDIKPTTFARLSKFSVSSSFQAVKPFRDSLCVLCLRCKPYHGREEMAPVVRAEPNGSQALLTFDGAFADLEEFGWLSFIRKFDGFNMIIARQFALSFDGGRAKVGDLQLEITEQSISSATGLPVIGEKWSKNYRVKDVPWTLLFRSRNVKSCGRGLPAKMLKPRWYDLLMILKQFITCEGRYGFVFLFHLRLLMVFMGFELNMPYYLHRSIFKMVKRYKRNQADTSLFHVGLIKILVVSELGLHRDSWQNFLNRNGFTEFNPPLVDKSMVSGDETNPVPYSVLLPTPEPDSPMAETKAVKPITSKSRAKNAVKSKRNARMISRMERNKSKPPVKTEPITIGDDSDSSIERFLAREGFDIDEPPYDFVDNLPPCLQDNPDYPGIKSSFETRGETSKPSPSQKATAPCDQCGLWLERYYLDVPKLQSKIRDLESQVAKLAGRNDKGHPNDKNQLTTGSIMFKNVESATAIVNSKLT